MAQKLKDISQSLGNVPLEINDVVELMVEFALTRPQEFIEAIRCSFYIEGSETTRSNSKSTIEKTFFLKLPHPERAYYGWQLPDWTGMEIPLKYGDGKLIFESMVDYMTSKF